MLANIGMRLIQADFSIQAETMNKILRKIYDFSESDNAFIIKLSPDSYLDLFNKLDHNPIRKKDLNQDVINYIEDCSNDISLDKNIILEIKNQESRSFQRPRKQSQKRIAELFRVYVRILSTKNEKTAVDFIAFRCFVYLACNFIFGSRLVHG